MEVKYTCPLGSECETAKDNVIRRCRWFIQVKGKDPQTGADIDEFRCAYEWNVFLQIENTGVTNELGAAIESFRNEMVVQNNEVLNSGNAVKESKLIGG